MELERRIFHLKTLYDVGQVIGSLRDPEQIMKNLLLMIMGTFGALRGMIVLVDVQQGGLAGVMQRGMPKSELESLFQAVEASSFADIKGVVDLQRLALSQPGHGAEQHMCQALVACQMHVWTPFAVNERFQGGIGLGKKLSGDLYTLDDQELLSTLANQLTIALDNALAYMEIRQLNSGLEAKVQERTAELRLQQEKLRRSTPSSNCTIGLFVRPLGATSLMRW